jgi:hypothetical protein
MFNLSDFVSVHRIVHGHCEINAKNEQIFGGTDMKFQNGAINKKFSINALRRVTISTGNYQNDWLPHTRTAIGALRRSIQQS